MHLRVLLFALAALCGIAVLARGRARRAAKATAAAARAAATRGTTLLTGSETATASGAAPPLVPEHRLAYLERAGAPSKQKSDWRLKGVKAVNLGAAAALFNPFDPPRYRPSNGVVRQLCVNERARLRTHDGAWLSVGACLDTGNEVRRGLSGVRDAASFPPRTALETQTASH